MVEVYKLLKDFGTVTLSLSSLIAIQLIICGIGMFLAGFAFLCVYEPKINGPLQSLIPIGKIKSFKKKVKKRRNKNNNHLSIREEKDQQRRESKHLMAMSSATESFTDIANI